MRGLKVGDEVSHLTLLGKTCVRGAFSRGKNSWKCKCVCGKEITRREDFFVEGKELSRGCQNQTRHRRGTKSPHWKGCGDLNGQYLSVVRAGSRRREIPFEITAEYAWKVFQEQEGKCKLTGAPLKFYGYRERKRGFVQTASLDRIDSTKGYVEGNVQWVHKDVNLMKNHFTEERFREVCRQVVEYENVYGRSNSTVTRAVA